MTFHTSLTTWLARARAMPRPVRLGIALFFLAGLADGTLMPFFALWAHRTAGVPTRTVGVLLGCYAGGELLATPFVGGVADRVGRRRTLLISTGGIAACFLLLCGAEGAVRAGLVLLAIGVFESVLHPTIAAVIADVAAPGSLRRHYALTRVASGVGHVVGPALGALLAARSLGLVFAGPGLAMLAGAVLVAARLEETAPASAEAATAADDGDGDDGDDDLGALLAAFRDARLATLLAPVAVIGLASSWIESVLPLYATGAGTISAPGIGLLFAWGACLTVAFQLPVVAWSSRHGGHTVAVLSGALLVLAFGALLATASPPALVVAVTLVSLADMLSGPTVQAIVGEFAPRTARGTYMAAFSAAHDLQDAAGPAIGTALFAVAPRLPWLVAVPVVATASLALASATRRQEAAATG